VWPCLKYLNPALSKKLSWVPFWAFFEKIGRFLSK